MNPDERAWLLNSLRHQRDETRKNAFRARNQAAMCNNPRSWMKRACTRLGEVYTEAAGVYEQAVERVEKE